MKEEWILVCNIAVVRKDHIKKVDYTISYENGGMNKTVQIPAVARTTEVKDLEEALTLMQSIEKNLDTVGTKIPL